MEYLLGIDIGTSGTKTVLFDRDANPITAKTFEYPLYQEQNGWAEQEPEDWWNAVVQGVQAVLQASGVDAADIKGIGLSGQMHGLVMLDENGEVLRRSIIWCDQRTGEEVEDMNRMLGAEKIIQITANPAVTGFTAAKILWVKKHEPELYAKCAHILLPKDYIRYKLTGEYATEVSDASGMQLMDVAKRTWSDEILEGLGIEKRLLGGGGADRTCGRHDCGWRCGGQPCGSDWDRHCFSREGIHHDWYLCGGLCGFRPNGT